MSNSISIYSFVLLAIFFNSCDSKAANNNRENGEDESLTNITTVSSDNNEDTVVGIPLSYPLTQLALIQSYSSVIKDIKNNYVYLTNGDSIVYDDGKEKEYIELLEASDIEDMFKQPYKLPQGEPEYLYDPGRSRSETLFKAMYGSSAKEVEQNLTSVDWFGQKVKFNKINGAADSLRAVAKELESYPEFKPYLKSSGTFYWRPVRGAKRMSAHSYGIAFDIGVDKSNYWQWTSGSNDEMKEVKYKNQIPLEIVNIFQKHGFIWGGAWYHYDTMHFEFRPDLLLYAKLTEKAET